MSSVCSPGISVSLCEEDGESETKAKEATGEGDKESAVLDRRDRWRKRNGNKRTDQDSQRMRKSRFGKRTQFSHSEKW